jgi:hypothetical protein
MDPATNVEWSLLLSSATRFAVLLGAKPPEQKELRQCVESVLLGRKALEAASFDIITQRELVDRCSRTCTR